MPKIKKSIRTEIELLKERFDNISKIKKFENYVNGVFKKEALKLANKNFLDKVYINLRPDSLLFQKDDYNNNCCNYKGNLSLVLADNKEFIEILFKWTTYTGYRTSSYEYFKKALRFKSLDFENTDKYIKEIFGNDFEGSASLKYMNFNPWPKLFYKEDFDKAIEDFQNYLNENEIIYNIENNYIIIDFNQFSQSTNNDFIELDYLNDKIKLNIDSVNFLNKYSSCLDKNGYPIIFNKENEKFSISYNKDDIPVSFNDIKMKISDSYSLKQTNSILDDLQKLIKK